MKLYVGNLARSVTEHVLREKFEECGEVISVKVMKDRLTGDPRGFAFVEMASEEQGQEAINRLNGVELEGRRLVVNQARPPEQRNGGGGLRRNDGGGRPFGGGGRGPQRPNWRQ